MGLRCQPDGTCLCGPAPQWQLVGGSCRPSCGVALNEAGFANAGAGCCPTFCLGRETEPTWDCASCCENPPGCS